MHAAYEAAVKTRTREELIRNGLPLVRRIAFRMVRRLPSHVEVDDLIAAGCEGLVRAADRYDASKHPEFEAYAQQRIRGAMLDELRVHDSMTSHGRRQLSHVNKTIRQIENDLGRAATEEEIADALGTSVESYRELAATLARGPALAGIGAADPDEVAAGSSDPASLLEREELRERLAEAIRNLPERSQLVLALYYQNDCTQAEIAEIIGVTEGRVCQLLGESTVRIRAGLSRDDLVRAAKRSARG